MSAGNCQKKLSLPEFDSYIELGEFWDTHSLADYWDQTEEAHIEFDPAQRHGSSKVKPMPVHKWADIRAKKFSLEEIEAIQKMVDAELADMESAGDHEMKLIIAEQIFDQFPELILGVVIAHNIDNAQDQPEITVMLRQAAADLPRQFGSTPVIEHPYIAPWREAYRKFGAKPKDNPSSVENLTRRVLNGATIGHINNLVSLYNTICLKYILPVGGEDLDKIAGDILLTQAGSDEPAVVLLGEKEARAPRAGEIIYKDDAGAICRRWNWKEADRTKLTAETHNAVLIIEALPPVPRAVVENAIGELAGQVQSFCGGAVATALLDKDNRQIELL